MYRKNLKAHLSDLCDNKSTHIPQFEGKFMCFACKIDFSDKLKLFEHLIVKHAGKIVKQQGIYPRLIECRDKLKEIKDKRKAYDT